MSSTTVVVVVLKLNGRTQEKVNEFERAEDAGRFIEDLLAAGIERESILVLAVQKLSIVITRKPVVSLVRPDWASRLRLPAPESNAPSKRGPVSAGATANRRPQNRAFDAEPLWAATGDGANVTVGDRFLPAVSLN